MHRAFSKSNILTQADYKQINKRKNSEDKSPLKK